MKNGVDNVMRMVVLWDGVPAVCVCVSVCACVHACMCSPNIYSELVHQSVELCKSTSPKPPGKSIISLLVVNVIEDDHFLTQQNHCYLQNWGLSFTWWCSENMPSILIIIMEHGKEEGNSDSPMVWESWW